MTSAVATATWKSTNSGFSCDGYSTAFTEYRAGKRLVLTRKLCDGITLDENTERSMQRIEPIVAKLGKLAPPEH